MKMDSLAIGVLVEYQNCIGAIHFISDAYVTICISKGKHKSQDTCILVYHENWNQITLLKSSTK